MQVYIVTEWNGAHYEDKEISNAGVFFSLDEAVKFCKNSPTDGLPYDEAYAIEVWKDGYFERTLSADGE